MSHNKFLKNDLQQTESHKTLEKINYTNEITQAIIRKFKPTQEGRRIKP